MVTGLSFGMLSSNDFLSWVFVLIELVVTQLLMSSLLDTGITRTGCGLTKVEMLWCLYL